MRRKIDSEELGPPALQHFHEQCLADLRDDPRLTEEEKQELLRQLELPDEEWEPIELPEGAEPISETIIKLRRESRG